MTSIKEQKNQEIGEIFIKAYNRKNRVLFSVDVPSSGNDLDLNVKNKGGKIVFQAEIIDVFDDNENVPLVAKKEFATSVKESIKPIDVGGIIKRPIDCKVGKAYPNMKNIVLLLNDRTGMLDQRVVNWYVDSLSEAEIEGNRSGFREIWFVFCQSHTAMKLPFGKN